MQTDRIERLSRGELEALQLIRLKNTIEKAASSQLYRSLFRSEDCAEKIESLSDLRYFPLTTKKALRDHYPQGTLAVDQNQIVRYHASSGTRGKPTIAAYTAGDLKIWSELVARSLSAAGVRRGDILHNAYGYGLFTGGIGLHYGAEALGATVIPAGGGRTSQQITLLEDLGARVLCATPSYALNIGLTLEESGKHLSNIKLELGILGAEPWTEPLRQQIENVLEIKALDIYGMSELIGPGVAVECIEARCGLHIWEDHFLPEIIDPVSGEPLPDGQEGELVVTTLTREAAPLVRFRTGDLTSLNRQSCICGRSMLRMARVRARIDDMLIVRGVNVYPSEIENILLKQEELTPNYQLVLRREKALDELCVQVEVKKESLIGELNERTDEKTQVLQLQERIAQLLKETLGLTSMVELAPPGSISRSEGKACRLIDLRSQSRSATQ